MDNRFYLQALGVTGLFVILMILFWTASGGPASEAAVQNANLTRTAIAMTGSYLLQPRTRTPAPVTMTPTFLPDTSVPASTSMPTIPPVPATASTSLLTQSNPPGSPLPSVTNTSLLPQFNTPISPVSFTPFPTQTAVVQIPALTATVVLGRSNTKAPRLYSQSATPIFPPAGTPVASQPGTSTVIQDPAEFARWYFTRVWNERDYQNLWDNYLTPSFKANVGSGLFEDYVGWWSSVARVDIHAVDVLQNNGQDALVRVNLTFHMNDGRAVENQVYEYDFLYDSSRGSWMFDSSP